MKENDKNQPNTKSIKLNCGDKVYVDGYPFVVEDECKSSYEVFYGFTVTHIPKELITYDNDLNQYSCEKVKINFCSDPFEPVDQYTLNGMEVKLNYE